MGERQMSLAQMFQITRLVRVTLNPLNYGIFQKLCAMVTPHIMILSYILLISRFLDPDNMLPTHEKRSWRIYNVWNFFLLCEKIPLMGKNGVCLVKRLKYPLFLGLQVDLQLASQICTSQIFANDLLQQH